MAYNYVEESPSEELTIPGGATGASGLIAMYGGMSVVSSFAELVHRSELPEDWVVIAGIPVKEGKGIAESGVEREIDRLRHYDRFMSARICYWVLMDLIPAFVQKDLKKIGDIVWDITLTSSKGVPGFMVSHKTVKPLETMIDLRNEGIEVTFMSSVGLNVFVITTEDKAQTAEDIIKRYGWQIVRTRVNNTGLEILERQ